MPVILKGNSCLVQLVTYLTYTWKMPGSHLGQEIDDPEVLLVSVSTAGLMRSRDSLIIMTRLLAELLKHNFNSNQG